MHARPATVRKAVRWNSPFYGIEDEGWILSFRGRGYECTS
jgi:hypothetical protein